MPIYESKCLKCSQLYNYYKSVDSRYDTPECCGNKTEKQITKTLGIVVDIPNWDAYVSPSTGKFITSKAERREDMKASGCRDWEGMESEKNMAARAKAEEEHRQEVALDKTARETWASFDPKKKEQIKKLVG